MDEPERARQACEGAVLLLESTIEARPEDPRVHEALGLAYAYLGRKAEAIREGERAVSIAPVSEEAEFGPKFVTGLARIYAMVGEPDAALDRIDHLLSIPGTLTVARLRTHAMWDPLRDHPRFAEILEKYGEQEEAMR
jgi:serine/threonine-protein kinase